MKTLVLAVLILIVSTAFIMLQTDGVSALTLFALIFVFYREGFVSGNFLLLGAASIALFIFTLLFSEWAVIGGLAVLAIAAVYFSKKTQKNFMAIGVGLVAGAIFVFGVDFAYNEVLQSHQRNRIEVLLGKIDDPRGEGYNVNQSLIAIGSGQLLGKGYLEGTQTKYNFVPEQSTDFIFCTIGEEWGF